MPTTVIRPNEYSALSPFVALIQQIVDETVNLSGVGATSFVGLADKTTADLPTLNSPLAIALSNLASKATADSHYANVSNPHSVTPIQIGAQPTLVSGTNIKTVGGVSLLGTGDVPATGGASAFSGLSDKSSADLPTINGPLLSALANKVPILNSVAIGSGAIALTAAAHANRTVIWTGASPQSPTIDTTGGVADDLYILCNQGTADVIMPGTAGAGYTLTIVPNTIGCVQWRGGSTFLSWIPVSAALPLPINDLTTGGSTSYASAQQLVVLKGLVDGVTAGNPPVSVSGSTVNGSVLTAAITAGWANAGGNWTRDGTDISGATALTYTTVSADGTHTVTYKSSNIPYVPTGIAVAAVITTAVLTIGSVTYSSSINLTTGGYLDYVGVSDDVGGGSSAFYLLCKKSGANILGRPTLFGGATGGHANTASIYPGVSWTDSKAADGTDPYVTVTGSRNLARNIQTVVTTQSGVTFTAPADGTNHKVRVFVSTNAAWGGTLGVLVRASLSNGAVAEQTYTFNNSDTGNLAEIVFNAGAAGQTLTVQIEASNKAIAHAVSLMAYTYGT